MLWSVESPSLFVHLIPSDQFHNLSDTSTNQGFDGDYMDAIGLACMWQLASQSDFLGRVVSGRLLGCCLLSFIRCVLTNSTCLIHQSVLNLMRIAGLPSEWRRCGGLCRNPMFCDEDVSDLSVASPSFFVHSIPSDPIDNLSYTSIDW